MAWLEQQATAPKPKRVRKPAKKAAKPKKNKVIRGLKQAVACSRGDKSKGRVRTVTLRPERLDLRLTKAEKSKLTKKAAATRRTITSIILELIEKMR